MSVLLSVMIVPVQTPNYTFQGRAFAIQEAQIALACAVQKFDFVLSNPSYSLELKQSLTLKPINFYVHAIPRAGKQSAIYSTPSKATPSEEASSPDLSQPVSGRHPMHVLYGSNTGTSESFAQRIASSAASHGASQALSLLAPFGSTHNGRFQRHS